MFSALKSATIQVNVQFKEKIDEPTLLGVLKGGIALVPWVHHLGVFLTELPPNLVKRVLIENRVSRPEIDALCQRLPEIYKAHSACMWPDNDNLEKTA